MPWFLRLPDFKYSVTQVHQYLSPVKVSQFLVRKTSSVSKVMGKREAAVHSFQCLCVGWGRGREEQESGRDGPCSKLETSVNPRSVTGIIIAPLAHPLARAIPPWED